MVAPSTARKPCLLEKVAGSTLVLCHTFPQERPTGRSGTASAGSGKSADAEVPSSSRKISWRLGRFFTAGAGAILPTDRYFVHQTQGSPGGRGRQPDLFRRAPMRPPIAPACAAILFDWRAGRRDPRASSTVAVRRCMAIPETYRSDVATTNYSAETGGLARAIGAQWQALPHLDHRLPDERGR